MPQRTKRAKRILVLVETELTDLEIEHRGAALYLGETDAGDEECCPVKAIGVVHDKPGRTKGKPLKQKTKVRLQLEVEGLINSRDEIPSSRVLADTIVERVEATVLRKRKPPKRARPWGSRFAITEEMTERAVRSTFDEEDD